MRALLGVDARQRRDERAEGVAAMLEVLNWS